MKRLLPKPILAKRSLSVAKVGHDTTHHKASGIVYDKLPDCCKYDRSSTVADPHARHKR